VSSFGRIKVKARYREILIPSRGTICFWSKEKILKQAKKKATNNFLHETIYFLTIALYKDGCYTYFSVPRLVYAHFAKDKKCLNKEMMVLHRDNDGLHNHFANLFVSNLSELRQKVYDKNRRESHFKNLDPQKRKVFHRKAVLATSKTVSQYSIGGVKLACYKSLSEASAKTNIKSTSITSALVGRYLTAGKFIWQYGDGKAKINTKRLQKKIAAFHQHNCKPVIQLDVDMKRLAEFPSITIAAAAVNGSARQLCDAVNGRSKTAYGFKWIIKS
jgi:hypothetical protein